jgi:hypothetical protein
LGFILGSKEVSGSIYFWIVMTMLHGGEKENCFYLANFFALLVSPLPNIVYVIEGNYEDFED